MESWRFGLGLSSGYFLREMLVKVDNGFFKIAKGKVRIRWCAHSFLNGAGSGAILNLPRIIDKLDVALRGLQRYRTIIG